MTEPRPEQSFVAKLDEANCPFEKPHRGGAEQADRGGGYAEQKRVLERGGEGQARVWVVRVKNPTWPLSL